MSGTTQRGILKSVLQPGIYYLNPKMVQVTVVPVGLGPIYEQTQGHRWLNYKITTQRGGILRGPGPEIHGFFVGMEVRSDEAAGNQERVAVSRLHNTNGLLAALAGNFG